MLARASWASTLGSRCPATIAWSMWRPDTPKMSLATDDSLIWASSRSLLHALLLPGPLPDERAPVPGQVTQPADRGWRHEAWPAHAPLDHLGQPYRIQLVGLGAAGDVLDVLGVEQPAGEPLGFQQVERRLPVVAGGLHRDQRHPSSVQPGGQVQQRPGGRGVLPDFLAAVPRLVVVRHSNAHRQGGLADVEGTDPLDQIHRLVGLLDVDHLHLAVPAGWEVARGANREERQADSRAQSNNAGPLQWLPPSDCYPGSTGTKHRRRPRATSPIFTPARGVPPGHRRLLCAVKRGDQANNRLLPRPCGRVHDRVTTACERGRAMEWM